MLKKIITPIAILLLLIIGNPSEQSLINSGVRKISPDKDAEVGLFGAAALVGASRSIEATAERKSYVIFSTGEYRVYGQTFKSVGFLWFWIVTDDGD